MKTERIKTLKGAELTINISAAALAVTYHHIDGDINIVGAYVGRCDNTIIGSIIPNGEKQQFIAKIAPAIAERLIALKKEEFEKIVRGYDELRSLMADNGNNYERNQLAIASGESFFGNYENLDDQIAGLKQKYPIAAAYIKAETFAMASNFEKSSAGSKAMESILDGEDAKKVIEKMEMEWATAAHNSVLNN